MRGLIFAVACISIALGAPSTKSAVDDVLHVINTVQEQLESVQDIQYTRYVEALEVMTNLEIDVIEATDRVVAEMFVVADERVEGLKTQGENAGVDISACFVDLPSKMDGAVRPYVEELREKASSNVEQCYNENAIIQSVIDNVNRQVAYYLDTYNACDGDEGCLSDLLAIIMENVNLPHTITVTVDKALSNIKYASRDIVYTNNRAISNAQYKLDRVIGLLDKCVHETIHH